MLLILFNETNDGRVIPIRKHWVENNITKWDSLLVVAVLDANTNLRRVALQITADSSAASAAVRLIA